MNANCQSCGMPLADPSLKGPSAQYCQYCADPQGVLHPREQVQRGIAEWLKGWQPGITEAESLARAAHYMKAMPAWADT